jgi:hypothetical protein
MPIQQLAPRTFNEICLEIAELEARFQLTTAEFLALQSPLPGIDEDEAVDWLYLAEQRRTLHEVAARQPYLRTEAGKPLKNSQCIMDRLAA